MSLQSQRSSIDGRIYEKLFYIPVKTLMDDYNFEYLNTLNWDLSGCVVSMLDKQRGVNVAVKIVREWNYDEEKLWDKLLYPHLLPLHFCTELDEMTKAFVTPLKANNVMEIIKSKQFQSRENNIGICKKWIYQIISGMNYLHKKGIYYLNMRLRNILVSNKMNASLCGFQYLTSDKIIEDPSKVGCRRVYRPPEVYLRDKETDRTDEMNSEKIDLWSFGIVSLEIITGHSLETNPMLWRRFSSEWTNWDREVGRIIDRILNDPIKFKTLVSNTYKNADLTHSDIEMFLNFLKKFIQRNSSLRMSTELGMKHDYFYPLNKLPATKMITTITREKVPKRFASTSCLQQTLINFDNTEENRDDLSSNSQIFQQAQKQMPEQKHLWDFFTKCF